MPRKPDIRKKDRYYDPFPTRLRILIAENGTKQEELKDVLRLKNRQSVTGYIDGETIPSIDHIVALAEYYKVSADWLLGIYPFGCRTPISFIQGTINHLSDVCEIISKFKE